MAPEEPENPFGLLVEEVVSVEARDKRLVSHEVKGTQSGADVTSGDLGRIDLYHQPVPRLFQIMRIGDVVLVALGGMAVLAVSYVGLVLLQLATSAPA